MNCSPAIADQHTFIAGCDEHLRVINVNTGEQTKDLELGTYLTASPSVMGDIIYMGTDGKGVLAINWKTLKPIWTYTTERATRYESSTAINEKYVIVGGTDKLVHCLDRLTGKPVWTTPTRAAVSSSPVIVGHRVFVGSVDSFLYELKLETGDIITKYPIGRNITASPAIGENCLVIGANTSAGKIVCLGKN